MTDETSAFSMASDDFELVKSLAPFNQSRKWRYKEIILQGPDWQTKLTGSTLTASWTDDDISGPFSLIFETHVESPVRRDERWHEIEAKDVGIHFLAFEEHGGQLMDLTGFGFNRVCGHYYHNVQKSYDINSHLLSRTRTMRLDGSFRTRVTWCR